MALSGSDFKKALAAHQSQPNEALIAKTLEGYARAGYSYLRDGGDNLGVCTAAAAFAQRYNIDYASPAFPLYEEGNYGSFLGKSFSNAQELDALLQETLKEGASFIKVMASGIMDFKTYGVLTGHALSFDYLHQIVNFAHNNNMPVMAHANGAEGLANCIMAKVDSIEHGYYLPLEYLDEMKKQEIVWVPTFAPLINILGKSIGDDHVIKAILEDHEKTVRFARQIRLPLAVGSDAGASQVLHTQGGQDEKNCLLNILCNDAHYLTEGNHYLSFSFPGKSKSQQIIVGN